MGQPDRDRFAGCLVGQCLGDAAGFIVEGQPPSVCRRYVDEALKTGLTEGLRRGEFSFGRAANHFNVAAGGHLRAMTIDIPLLSHAVIER
jgi:hypothetical protein